MEEKIWEVESKYHVDDLQDLESRLCELRFLEEKDEFQEDVYFRHPCRDFKKTDEAFRIRRVNQAAWVTYKGPRQTGPVKTREEIELPIQTDDLNQWQMVLRRLGFESVPAVQKNRRTFRSSLPQHESICVAIDRVVELGDFAEVEIVVCDTDGLQAAQAKVTRLSGQLGLSRLQPRSYLDQLMELRSH